MDHKPEQEHLIGYDEFDQAGTDLIKKRKWKNRMGLAAIGLVIVIVAGSSLAIFLATRQEGADEDGFAGRGNGGFGGNRQDMVTATGTTAIGMDEVVFDIDFLEETSLYVEEVYISSQDEVEAETKILKFTEESIADARAELEETLQNATLTYRSSVITTQESEIEAQYTYKQSALTATQAQDVYDDTLADLLVTLNQAKESYDEAQEAYDELYQQIVDNTFYADYEVEAKEKAYEEALNLYETKMEDWGLTEDDLSSSSSSMGAFTTGSSSATQSTSTSTQQTSGAEAGMEMPEGMEGQMAQDGNASDVSTENQVVTESTEEGTKQATGQSRVNTERQGQIKAAKLLKEEAEETEQEYEEAHEAYLDAIEHAELNLKTLLNKLEQAKAAYTEADLKYQKEVLSAKTTYQTSLAKNQTAQNEYDTELTSLSEELDKLKDEMEEAQENLDTFEALVGDGYLYTEEAGTVMMIRVREEEVLSGGDMIMAYTKPDEMTVSVSVSQDAIAELNVGDTATVMFNEYGTFSGTITSINPISSSSSRTSVTYTVQVSLEGDVSELEANLTATVIFGEMPQMEEGQQRGERPEGMEMPSGGEMPEGMEMPSGGDRPEGMEMPSGGEMPEGMERPSGMNKQEDAGNE